MYEKRMKNKEGMKKMKELKNVWYKNETIKILWNKNEKEWGMYEIRINK